MMKIYKNTKTGATFTTASIIKGGDWVEVTQKVVIEPKVEEKEPEQTEELVEQVEEDSKTEVPDDITKAQIMQELDALGVEYNKKATKTELYALMMAQGE
ncbi:MULTISPECIES: hypothetical protein [Lactococcus]|nr:hypothetical protein [Lactococcus sp. UBA7128]